MIRRPWLVRLTTVALVTGLAGALWPSAVLADHCGGLATVEPKHGPPGTVFMFRANVGAPSELTFYHDGTWAGSVFLSGSGEVSYSISSRVADVGHWAARAAVIATPECYGEAEFEVDGPAWGIPAVAYPILLGTTLMALILVAAWAVRRRRSRGDR